MTPKYEEYVMKGIQKYRFYSSNKVFVRSLWDLKFCFSESSANLIEVKTDSATPTTAPHESARLRVTNHDTVEAKELCYRTTELQLDEWDKIENLIQKRQPVRGKNQITVQSQRQ